ncbi:hypothetical protein ES702_02890 [subsurface metagenome]
MSNEDRRSLCQRIRPWIIPIIQGIIVGVIVGAIVVIITALISIICKPPDFSISVNPVTGATNPGSVEQTMVNIGRIWYKRYKYSVTLCAETQNPAIKVTFIPEGGPTPPYNSTMKINIGSGVSEDYYIIEIEGIGGDGREHTCKYVLFVRSIPDNGEPPPAEEEEMFVGGRESDVYHYSNCRYVNMINAENIIWFTSVEDARSHGYRPCRVCRPP